MKTSIAFFSHLKMFHQNSANDSVQFSHSVVSDSLRPCGLQHARLPCPSPAPDACWNSCPSSRWCHPTISSSVVPFTSCLQSFPASGSFPMSQFFASGGQNIGKLSEKKVKVKSISHVRLFVTSGTVAHQASLSMGFSRQEYWSGLPFPSPVDLSDPEIKLRSPELQADTLTSEPLDFK